MELEILPSNIYENPILTKLEKSNLSGILKAVLNRLETNLKEYIKKVVTNSIDEKILSITKDDEYLTIQEACKLLKVSRATLYRWSDEGKVNRLYLFGNPRFSKDELTSLLKSVESKSN